MASRLELHELLKDILGSNNVYHQPPASVQMHYPCIRYSRDDVYVRHADDLKYFKRNRYEVIHISRNPDDPVVEKLLNLPMCEFQRHYTADNLNHNVFELYF